ncbi:MAG TPA: hypothetical protein VHN79_04100 [Lacunisphaera sp.]|nr:hypothetical protein [Lacunisphaera sp.]
MFGYILACVIGVIVLGFLLAGLARAPAGSGSSSRLPNDRPVQANAPAADAPTPDRSVTAAAHEVRSAKKHTPPA